MASWLVVDQWLMVNQVMPGELLVAKGWSMVGCSDGHPDDFHANPVTVFTWLLDVTGHCCQPGD